MRRGCPLSPLFILLCLKPFCLRITCSEFVRGFQLQTVEVRFFAYADNVPVFCMNMRSASHVAQLMREPCEASGAAVIGRFSKTPAPPVAAQRILGKGVSTYASSGPRSPCSDRLYVPCSAAGYIVMVSWYQASTCTNREKGCQ